MSEDKWKGQYRTDVVSSDEWYTPSYIIESLGIFDTDPCAALNPIFKTAEIMYNKSDDGLTKEWTGRVWLNPPYSNDLLKSFLQKMAAHNNGIALLFNRCDNTLFYDLILKNAVAIKFLRRRIRFYKPDGSIGKQPGTGSILIAFGENNIKPLENCELEGTILYTKRNNY